MDVKFYLMYLIEYKFPLLSQMCFVKTSQVKTLIFSLLGQNTWVREIVHHLVLY